MFIIHEAGGTVKRFNWDVVSYKTPSVHSKMLLLLTDEYVQPKALLRQFEGTHVATDARRLPVASKLVQYDTFGPPLRQILGTFILHPADGLVRVQRYQVTRNKQPLRLWIGEPA